jgi:tetratricopeptide (TPR) repeat protein
MRRYLDLGFAWTVAILLVTITMAAMAPAASAQDSGGAVDTRQSTKDQIARLEFLVKGDVSPDKQVVYLRWLADLYTLSGDLDAAQKSYERILDFDPYDVATSNLLAAFLLDQRHDAAGAEKVLEITIGWATRVTPTPLFLGTTYSLHARALRTLGRYQESIDAVEKARDRLDADAAEDALRTEALSLKALGKNKEATAVFEQLIGLTGGSNADDTNALIALETAKHGSINADAFRARQETLIENARKERAEAFRHEGAEMVVLEGEGHVRLEGTLRRGKGAGAVVLVPDLGGRRSAYTPYAQLLAIDGITTLAIDPRGHGDSRCDSLPSFLELSADQRDHIPDDIAAAQRYLRDTLKIPAKQIAVISEGAVCTDVEHAMHDLNLGAIVIHLSPIVDPLDRDVVAAMEFRAPRPTLLVVSDEDMFSVQSVNAMRAMRTKDPLEVHTVHASGHGVGILHEPEHYAWVSSWLADEIAANK